MMCKAQRPLFKQSKLSANGDSNIPADTMYTTRPIKPKKYLIHKITRQHIKKREALTPEAIPSPHNNKTTRKKALKNENHHQKKSNALKAQNYSHEPKSKESDQHDNYKQNNNNNRK
jgi:hypothetical protein